MGIYNLNDNQEFATYQTDNSRENAPVIDELCKEIVKNSTLAFVGAGVSMRSGLKGWVEFIKSLYKTSTINEHDRDLIDQYIKRNDLITGAELIRLSTNQSDFKEKAARYFLQIDPNDNTDRPGPNDTHRLITRIFQKIITTNYDDLLFSASDESAIIGHPTAIRDAEIGESEDFIKRLLSPDPAIVKIHGSCTEPNTMIITRSDYLKAYSGGYLMNWLRTNLTQKSFLFVGYSLSDYEIVNLIKEAKAALPKHVQFVRHFAIVDSAGTSRAHQKYLRNCYNIDTIVDDIVDAKRSVLRDIFVKIHGLCAQKKATGEGFITGPPIVLQWTMRDICKSIRRAAGADYIALYMTEDIDRINLSGMCKWIGKEKFEHYEYWPKASKDRSPPPDDLKRLFLRMRDCNYYYEGAATPAEVQKFAPPWIGTYQLRSLLIIPVASQGKKVGVLVIGSTVTHAFTADHYEALAIHTRIIADSYKALLRKLNTVRSAHLGVGYNEALSYLRTSRLLQGPEIGLSLGFIFYAVDYERGKLIPHIPDSPAGTPTWPELDCKETYLATVALSTGATLHFINREEAMHYVRDHPNVRSGLEHFKVEGNLYITPIRSNGYISTILVCWINSETKKKRYTKFERAKRIARILFNNFKDESIDKPAYRFLNLLDATLKHYDGGVPQLWQDARQKPHENAALLDQLVRAVLYVIVNHVTRLTRVRLWVRVAPTNLIGLEEVWDRVTAKLAGDAARKDRTSHTRRDRISFRIDFADVNPLAVPSNLRAAAVHQYEGKESDYTSDDEYTRNTLDRYASDPYAREIDPMSGDKLIPDKNCPTLEKDPSGSWLTVPLVYRDREGDRKLRLLGFLSADDHRYEMDDPTGRPVYRKPPANKAETAAALLAFQRCVLDLAAHIIAPLIAAKYFSNP